MTGYPGNTKVAATGASPELSQVQFQIAALTEPIQELMKPKVGREQIWCTTCKTEDHHAHECPLNRRGVGVAQNPSGGPFPGRPGEELCWCLPQLLSSMQHHSGTRPHIPIPTPQSIVRFVVLTNILRNTV